MRRFLLATIMFGCGPARRRPTCPTFQFCAAASPTGRPRTGSTGTGVYVGGQRTRGGADMDFTNASQDLLPSLSATSSSKRSSTSRNGRCGKRAHNVGHRLWRLRRPQLAVGRCAVGVETNYNCTARAWYFERARSRSFQLPPGCITTRSRYRRPARCAQIKDYGPLPRARRLVHRQLPALRVRRPRGRTGGHLPEADATLGLSYVGTTGLRHVLEPRRPRTMRKNHFVAAGPAASAWNTCCGMPVPARRVGIHQIPVQGRYHASTPRALGIGYKF